MDLTRSLGSGEIINGQYSSVDRQLEIELNAGIVGSWLEQGQNFGMALNV